MKEIAISGGKGGVGKSTVAILLANDLRKKGKKVVLCDLDVECPNDYLLVGKGLGRLVQKVYARLPKLLEEKCSKCGLCVKNCRSNAIFMPKGEYPIFLKDFCSRCSLCGYLCPKGAIKFKREVIGKIYLTKLQAPSSKFPVYLITGRSVGLVEETGPVVTKTREFAQKFAQKIDADYLLLDTAPGLHCNVIRALFGADLAWAVTEPTPLGAHDLELVLRLLKLLQVPAKIILNQADLGDKQEIEKISRKNKIEIEKEIPYSKKIVEAYSKGELFFL